MNKQNNGFTATHPGMTARAVAGVEDIVEFIDDFNATSVSSTDNLLPWFATVNSGTAAIADDGPGGLLKITTHTTQNNVVNVQQPGEAYKLAAGKRVSFVARLALADADNEAVFVGLSITDTAILDADASPVGQGAVSDAVGFVWTGAALWAVASKNGSTAWISKVVSVETLADDVYVELEFHFDGAGHIVFLVDGIQVAEITDTAATVTLYPDDEALTPTIEVQNLEAGTVANIAYVDRIEAYQER